ncbi:MAG TPA: xanthine dehydrogenase family protein molybdopterin-binding subunit [Candidatus Dormibacteraeota bacterium]|jgi:carbon-monoxide dehydrogenase large subunit|nr:xanthine dehydrogenase family protein molybdopterin-binding subunit [Candidatus Dormibacteraeota bacterium]
MSILGNRVLRIEDPRLLTEGGTYMDDVPLEGAAHLVYVRSPMAHAAIRGIDTGEARAMPGVIAVLTGADFELPSDPPMGGGDEAMSRPTLARHQVCFAGQSVAIVVAQTRAQAVDAAEMVMLDYDHLPAVVDPEAAAEGAPYVHEAAGTNIVREFGELDPAIFEGCEVVVSQRVVNNRVIASSLETRGAMATWSEDGKLTYWLSTQGVHDARNVLANALKVDAANIRVIAPDVGGGFGTKVGLAPDELLVAAAARAAGVPVRWTETRSEAMANGHGRAQVQHVTVGGSRDGHIEAYQLDILQDVGAYAGIGAFLPQLTRMMACGTYDFPRVAVRARNVVTTTSPVIAYRGAGRPEACAAVERAVDLFANEIGMDPAEVRRRNVITPDKFPFTTKTGATYDSGEYTRALDLVLDAAGYSSLRDEQQRRRQAGDSRLLGLGMSLYVEITAGGGGSEYASIEMRQDGRAILRIGASPQGQGHATVWATMVSDTLGIPIDAVTVISGDTGLVPEGHLTGGSRSVQIAGSAVAETSDLLVQRAREVAAELLEADPADIVHDRTMGRFHVAGVPSSGRGWADIAEAAAPGGLVVEHRFQAKGSTFPFGAHLAVVEVDAETGKVTLQRFVAVDDAGRILNPLLAEGQRHGGIAQGAAQALLEEVRYDADGNLLTSTFADYEVITAAELPDFQLVPMETPTPLNQLGAKGIGESGTVGATPAVHNAVVDALLHLGVRHVDMPCAPERVWTAMRDAGGRTAEVAR